MTTKPRTSIRPVAETVDAAPLLESRPYLVLVSHGALTRDDIVTLQADAYTRRLVDMGYLEEVV